MQKSEKTNLLILEYGIRHTYSILDTLNLNYK